MDVQERGLHSVLSNMKLRLIAEMDPISKTGYISYEAVFIILHTADMIHRRIPSKILHIQLFYDAISLFHQLAIDSL